MRLETHAGRGRLDEVLEKTIRDIDIPPRPAIIDRICHEMRQDLPNFRFPDLGGNRVGTSDKSEGHSCPGFRMRKILQGEFLEERGDSAIMSWAGHPVNFDGQGVG